MKLKRRKKVMDPGGATNIHSDRRRVWRRLVMSDRRKMGGKVSPIFLV